MRAAIDAFPAARRLRTPHRASSARTAPPFEPGLQPEEVRGTLGLSLVAPTAETHTRAMAGWSEALDDHPAIGRPSAAVAWLEGFKDQVVLVTGASSGIGRATALAFAAAGARVALLARRRAVLDAVAAETTGRTLPVAVDVTDRDQVEAAFDRVVAEWGRVDIVVNNAGILIPGPVVDLAASDLEAMLRVNLFGALFVMQAAVRRMRVWGGGCIVNVGSLAGRRGISPLGGYSATKFALVGLTEALRTELHGHPLHVALVLPGVIDTPMADHVAHDPEFLDLWPSALNMPPSWVVWAVFAAARFHLIEVSVPPGAATLEKLAALAPGVADTIVHWAKTFSHWIAHAPKGA